MIHTHRATPRSRAPTRKTNTRAVREVAIATILLAPRGGEQPQNQPQELFIDTHRRCTSSPCRRQTSLPHGRPFASPRVAVGLECLVESSESGSPPPTRRQQHAVHDSCSARAMIKQSARTKTQSPFCARLKDRKLHNASNENIRPYLLLAIACAALVAYYGNVEDARGQRVRRCDGARAGRFGVGRQSEGMSPRLSDTARRET